MLIANIRPEWVNHFGSETRRTRSIAWILILPGHQQQWYWPDRIKMSSFLMRKAFNHVRNLKRCKMIGKWSLCFLRTIRHDKCLMLNVWCGLMVGVFQLVSGDRGQSGTLPTQQWPTEIRIHHRRHWWPHRMIWVNNGSDNGWLTYGTKLLPEPMLTYRQYRPVLLNWGKFDSLAPGKIEWNYRYVIFKQISVINGWGISCEIALIQMSLDFIDDQSTLVQVMAWCRQATSHYLSQCWPSSLSPYGVTRPQWVNYVHYTSITKTSITIIYLKFHLNLPVVIELRNTKRVQLYLPHHPILLPFDNKNR